MESFHKIRRKANPAVAEEDLGRGIRLEMSTSIPGGRFQMGSPATEVRRQSIEGPTRQVTVGAFAMGRYEVTPAQWRAVMGTNPSFFTGDNLPVEQVTWEEAPEFCASRIPCLGSAQPTVTGCHQRRSGSMTRTVTDTPSIWSDHQRRDCQYFGPSAIRKCSDRDFCGTGRSMSAASTSPMDGGSTI
jgi:hypothetical protein